MAKSFRRYLFGTNKRALNPKARFSIAILVNIQNDNIFSSFIAGFFSVLLRIIKIDEGILKINGGNC